MEFLRIFFTLSLFLFLSCFNRQLIAPNDKYRHDVQDDVNSIIFIGDTQKTNSLQIFSEKNIGIQDSLFKQIAIECPDLIIHLGDIVESGSSKSDWIKFDTFSKYVDWSSTSFMSILGNHEYYGHNKQALANFFSRFKYFKKNQTWFSFIVNGLGIILINSNKDNMKIEELNYQLNWFNNKIDEFDSLNSVDHIIIVSHHPPYTNMKVKYFKNSLPFIDKKERDNYYLRENYVQKYLKSKKAALFISGHTHSYEHFIIDEKHFIVSGGGGAPRDPISLDGDYHDIYNGPSIRNFNYCKLIKNDNYWTFEMIELTKYKKWRSGERFVINKDFTNK